MVRYEGLLLANPQITQDEITNLETAIDKIIQAKQGSMISFERWGKYKLAYPVKKNEYGVYFLVRFDASEESSIIADLKMLFETKLNNIIMRIMFTRLAEGQPLAYQRPKSLEEMPAREEFSHKDKRGDRDFYSSNDKDDEGKDDDDGAE